MKCLEKPIWRSKYLCNDLWNKLGHFKLDLIKLALTPGFKLLTSFYITKNKTLSYTDCILNINLVRLVSIDSISSSRL